MIWFPTIRRLWPSRWFAKVSFWPVYSTRRQQQSLLRIIAKAVEHGVPLPPLLKAYAEDEIGGQRRRIRQLAELLARGVSLADAVEQVKGVLSDDGRLAVRLDAQSGTGVRLMSKAADDHDECFLDGQFFGLSYYAIVSIWSVLNITFLIVKVFPTLSVIAEDLGVEQGIDDGPFAWLVQLSYFVGYWWWAFVLAFAVCLWYVVSGRLARSFRSGWLQGFIGPWLNFRTTSLLNYFGVAVATGRPMAGILSTMARYHHDPVVRQRLLFVRNEVEQGANTWLALKDARLVRGVEADALVSAEHTGTLQSVLERLANARKSVVCRRMGVAAQLIYPAFALLFGGLVLLVSTAIVGTLAQFVFASLN